MSIGKKLFITLAVTVLALLAVGSLGLVNLTVVRSLEDGIYRENIVAMEALNKAAQNYLKMRVVIRDLVFSPAPEKTVAFRKQLYEFDAAFRARMKEYREAVHADSLVGDATKVLGDFQGAYEDYQKILEDLFTLVQAGKQAQAIETMYNTGADRARAMTDGMEALLATNRKDLDGRFANSGEVVDRAYLITAILLVIATAFSLGAAGFLTRAIARPLIRSAALAQRLSEGDLTVKSDPQLVRRKDEVGTLAKSIDALAIGLLDFVKTLKTTGAEIDRTAKDLDNRASGAALAAARIAGATHSGHELAHSQAAGVTETTATVAQITSTIEKFDRLIEDQSSAVTQSSASLEQMASNIRSLSNRAAKLGEAFSGLKATSDDGRDKLYAMVSKIETIAAQSERLADANNTIKTIASQTNLLSMNAAIEAAHAGHAGAGFAVVADEIRKLAEAASHRSKDISQEVRTIQNLIAETSKDSETVKSSFGAVLDRVSELGYFEAEMTNALIEQDEGAKQILEATAQVSTVTAEVRQGSTEILEGSQAIRREMEELLSHSRQLEASLQQVSTDGTAITAASAGVLEDSAKNRELAGRLDDIVGVFQV